jgi:hypothetical protein
VRIIDCDELYPGVHEGRDKCDVPGQSIQLGNDELGFLFFAGCNRLLQFWPIIALSALDLCKFSN